MPEIVQLLVSRTHRYVGRPGPGAPLGDDLVDALEVRAGLGIVGDRYFNAPAHRDASVTVLASESLAPWPGIGLRETRRNIALRGVAVDDAARDDVLVLDCGAGVVRLRVTRPARPCGWLDVTIAPGARRSLGGLAGVRCVPLTDGGLRVGPVTAGWE